MPLIHVEIQCKFCGHVMWVCGNISLYEKGFYGDTFLHDVSSSRHITGEYGLNKFEYPKQMTPKEWREKYRKIRKVTYTIAQVGKED